MTDTLTVADANASKNSEALPNPNLFTEFASSVWRSGVQRPVQSLGQLVGLNSDEVQTDDHLSGIAKVANIAGNATGQLLDLGLLSVGLGKALGVSKVASNAEALEGLTTAKSLALNGATGAIYGGLLTPVQQGESQWSRLGNATVDAGTFAALGFASSKLSAAMGDGLLSPRAAALGDGVGAKAAQIAAGVGDRAVVSLGSGAIAGLTNTQLDALTHGKATASLGDYATNTFGWAVGNAVLGEATRQVVGAGSFAAGLARDHLATTGDAVTTKGTTAEAASGNNLEAASHADATDTTGKPKERVKPELDLRSMKEIAESGDEDRVRKLVNMYYPKLQKAFPLAGEIEDPETYVKYLMDPNMKWEMEQLLGPVQGGLQYQVLDVNGDKIAKAGWLEHIWVADNVREGGYGSELLNHVSDQVSKKGGDITFWEWNNPDKMTADEIAEDEKGGITTQDRVSYWAKRGAYIAVVPSTGEIAPYAQPGMDGQDEVAYLSLAFSKPGGLEGQSISKSDYLKTLMAAHDTITETATDPTVQGYKAQIDAFPDQEFKFVKLADFIKQRTESLQQEPEGHEAHIARWTGDDFTPISRNVIDINEAPVNEEVAKALDFQRQSTSPWLRTMEDTKRFPTLKGDVQADTVVVGSGVVGQQIADKLSAMGLKVVVLERGKVGSGTSGMMGAMNTFVPDTGFEVMQNSFGPGKFEEMMRRSIAARSDSESLGRQFGDFKPVDSYNIGYSDNNEGIAAEARIAAQFDPSVKFVTGADAEKIFPLARSAAIFPREGNLNPRKMLIGMASSGRYSTYEDSPALGVAPSQDGADVFTPEGVVHAKKVIFATNGPVTPFSYLNDHLTPVQTFGNIAEIGRRLPGNFFDAPDQTVEKAPFSYWRQFDLPGFKPDETLVGGTAHMLDTEAAVPFEANLPIVTKKLFGADGRDQSTAVIFTSYADGAPIYGVHPKYPFMSIATGGGGNGLVAGALLAQAAKMEASGHNDDLLSPNRFLN